METAREGGCSCGDVRYRLASEPLFTHCCYRLNCQRQAGSAFVINLLIEADRVELLAGTPQPVEVRRDDGSKQVIFRCPTCQVAIFSTGVPTCASFAAAPSTSRRASSPTPHLHQVEAALGHAPGVRS